jgi:farnesyl diphosphate synthase
MMNDVARTYLERHEEKLHSIINSISIPATRLKDAIQYSLFPGGKRFRPLLVYLTGELSHAPIEALDAIAISIELAHCFSLVHDDLPAMDNDDYRRGKLSCHKAFDEATAILAGDGMQALAIEILLSKLPYILDSEKTLRIAWMILKAIGVEGMLSGQSLDLTELSTPISKNRLCEIHQLKTGRVIQACVESAIVAGSCSKEESEALYKYGHQLGLLFQMQDDYLDRYATHQLGKNRSSDLMNEKTTFATLCTEKELEELIINHHEKLEEMLSLFGYRAHHLQNLVRNLLKIKVC